MYVIILILIYMKTKITLHSYLQNKLKETSVLVLTLCTNVAISGTLP